MRKVVVVSGSHCSGGESLETRRLEVRMEMNTGRSIGFLSDLAHPFPRSAFFLLYGHAYVGHHFRPKFWSDASEAPMRCAFYFSQTS